MDKAQQIFQESLDFLHTGELIKAEAGFNFLLDHSPKNADLWFYLGTIYMSRGFPTLAEKLFRENLKLDPKSVSGYNNLGFIYKQDNQNERAEKMFLQGIRYFPDGADPKDLAMMYNNLATLYVNNGTPKKAVEYCLKGFECDTQNPQLHWNYSLALLELGQWKEGWLEHEWGFQTSSGNPALKASKRKDKDYGGLPRWDGEKGKTVIVYGEQGLGDEIMFASMLPDLQKVCNVIYDAHPRLTNIMRDSFPGIDVYGTRKELETPWVDNYEPDCRVAIGSLGKFFRNSQEDFPKTPYLKVEKSNTLTGQKPKIGISWKGGYKSTRKDLRSVTLDQLQPILELDADFYSLQYTKNADKEISEFTERTGIVIHHDQSIIDDYDKTAAFIQELDVVVSVCTSIIHLSGALGVPCWVLTPSRPAWRYGVKGEMPWYDSIRLFRQSGDDWDSVIQRVRKELCKQYQKTIAA